MARAYRYDPDEGPGPSSGPMARLFPMLAAGLAAGGLAGLGMSLLPEATGGVDETALIAGGWGAGGIWAGWAMAPGFAAGGRLRTIFTALFGLALCCALPVALCAAWVWLGGAGLIMTSGSRAVGVDFISLAQAALGEGAQIAFAPLRALPVWTPPAAWIALVLLLRGPRRRG